MLCPKCSQDTNVIDSRTDSQYVRRRRECIGCKERYTTVEIIAHGTARGKLGGLLVVDRRDVAETIRCALEEALNKTLFRVQEAPSINGTTPAASEVTERQPHA